MSEKLLPQFSPEEMSSLEKQRTLSDAEMLQKGAEYKFDAEGNKKLDVTGRQLEQAKRDMDEYFASVVEAEPEHESIRLPILIKETMEKDGRNNTQETRVEYDNKGRKKVEESTKEISKEDEYSGIMKPKSNHYFYDESGNVRHEMLRNYKNGWLEMNDNYYDERGRLSKKEWQTRERMRPTENLGSIEFTYKEDGKGRVMEKIGRGKDSHAYIIHASVFQYDEGQNIMIENRRIVAKYYAGPMADQTRTVDEMLITQKDSQDRVITEAVIRKNKEGAEAQDVHRYTYNEKGERARDSLTEIGFDGKQNETITNYEYELGDVKIDR